LCLLGRGYIFGAHNGLHQGCDPIPAALEKMASEGQVIVKRSGNLNIFLCHSQRLQERLCLEPTSSRSGVMKKGTELTFEGGWVPGGNSTILPALGDDAALLEDKVGVAKGGSGKAKSSSCWLPFTAASAGASCLRAHY
jgi:hypothetical protein